MILDFDATLRGLVLEAVLPTTICRLDQVIYASAEDSALDNCIENTIAARYREKW
jgi:hypothetical protein